MNNLFSKNLLFQKSLIFWDFDGVIKDSVDVKGSAFVKLFENQSGGLVLKIKEHHLSNGGISRYEKIKLYLTWAGIEPSESIVNEYANKFSALVLQEVINSKWIPGVREYLETNFQKQTFILVTATPQKEIEKIVNLLGIANCFNRIYGFPSKKEEVIKKILLEKNINSNLALMIGDSESDYDAALKNEIMFVLRAADYNYTLQEKLVGLTFKEL